MPQSISEAALILAPLGRDARIAAALLQEANIQSQICADVAALVAALRAGAGFAVVTEEAIRSQDVSGLVAWLGAQPSWSDFPFLALTGRGGGTERNAAAERLTEVLGNVSFLERPFHPTTFVAAARTALRTRRKQYAARNDQHAIRESESKWRFALEAGRLGSWELDVQARNLVASPICKANFGRAPDDAFSYEDLLAAIHPDDRRAMQTAALVAAESNEDYQLEYRVLWPDATVHWVEVRGRRVVRADGRVYLMGISQDITARREAEVALRSSEARYRTLAETLPQLVWTCEADGNCSYLSRQWVEYTGMAEAEQLGLRWLDAVIHPDDKERTQAHWLGAVAGHHGYDIEYRIRRHDGRYHWFKTRGTPIRDLSGNIVSWFGTCTDSQDVVEAREVMARSSEELAHLVAERTAALEASVAERDRAQDALRQSQKMEAVGQLTGGIAHDFNNLLQVISGGLQIIEYPIEPARRQKILDGMRRATERGNQLTRQLLAFSRKQALHPQRVNVGQQIIAMQELLDRSLRGDISIDTSFPTDLWPVYVDPTQFELAVINIAVNARDAMPHGGTLTVRAENAARLQVGQSHDDFVRITFSDNGTGMSPEVVRRVFEPFFTTKEVGKGSGLGLPQVYGFTTQSGGTVELHSALGAGTTVALLLPRCRAPLAPDAPDPVAFEIHPPRMQSANARSLVLLVEDDEEVAALATEMLSQLGYDATRVATAAAALGALADNRPVNLVFTDVMMPGGMSGAELAREIRRRRPDLPVILTTGYDGDALAEAEAAQLPLLRKPYRLEALSQVLGRTHSNKQ